MSLYHTVFGFDPDKVILVDLLRLVQEIDVGRYRDAWIESHGDDLLIRIHTRNGGGNRDDQAEAIDSMRAHPWYVRDEDLEFDHTYADFWFRPQAKDIDEAIFVELVRLAIPPVDVSQRWRDVIHSVEASGRTQASDQRRGGDS